jgi:hypothetical protein
LFNASDLLKDRGVIMGQGDGHDPIDRFIIEWCAEPCRALPEASAYEGFARLAAASVYLEHALMDRYPPLLAIETVRDLLDLAEGYFALADL